MIAHILLKWNLHNEATESISTEYKKKPIWQTEINSFNRLALESMSSCIPDTEMNPFVLDTEINPCILKTEVKPFILVKEIDPCKHLVSDMPISE